MNPERTEELFPKPLRYTSKSRLVSIFLHNFVHGQRWSIVRTNSFTIDHKIQMLHQLDAEWTWC